MTVTAESFRFTVFTASPVVFREQNWWADIVGEPPENEANVPKLGQYQQTGPFENGVLGLVIQPDRIDWQWSPEFDLASQDKFPTLGEPTVTSIAFGNLMKKWIEFCPKAVRLAYGETIIRSVTNRDEGYEEVVKLINFQIGDLKGAADFMFQINWPRKSSAVPDLSINRLTNWSVAKFTRLRLPIVNAKSYPTREDSFAVRLVMDINTDGERQEELPSSSILLLFEEMETLAKEIVEKGDCK